MSVNSLLTKCPVFPHDLRLLNPLFSDSPAEDRKSATKIIGLSSLFSPVSTSMVPVLLT